MVAIRLQGLKNGTDEASSMFRFHDACSRPHHKSANNVNDHAYLVDLFSLLENDASLKAFTPTLVRIIISVLYFPVH